MKIILANGTELAPIMVTGGTRFIQGANRDALSFLFPASVGMENINALFSEENCERIIIEETVTNNAGETVTNKYAHGAYTIRVELNKMNVEIQPETVDTPAVYEDRIRVVMAQRTYLETRVMQLEAENAALGAQLTDTQLALCDVYEAMLTGETY